MQNNNNSSNNNNTLNRQRSNGKGKFLTRSHAMRESTSPPRTPTPRSGNLAPSAAINDQQQQSSSTIKNENSNRNLSTSPVTVNSQLQPTPSPPTQSSTNLFATNGNISVTQLDLEFPKLTPPKSKSPRNNNNLNTNNNNSTALNSSNPSPNTIAGNRNSEMNKSPLSAGISSSCNGPVSPATSTSAVAPLTPPAVSNPRIADSVPSNDLDRSRSVSPLPASPAAAVVANASLTTELLPKTVSLDVPKITTSPANAMCTIKVSVATDQQRSSHEHLNTPDSKDKSIDEPNEMVNRKNRNNPNVKGAKTSRPKHGACSLDLPGNHLSNDYTAMDGGGSSSGEHFTDQNGVDLLQFFKITLNKNTKDRSMLLRIEKELASLAQDESRDVIRFPTMSSYNRMLIHRVAAWFGMEHNVDGALQCVIVGTTKTTRIPEIRFKSLLSDTFTDEPLSRKSILKRDAHSFEEYRQGLLGCPDRSMLDRKAKSFEEREQEYERAKRRIFKDMEHDSIEQFWHNWSSSNSGAPDQYNKFGCSNGAQKAQNNRLLKVQSTSMDTRYDGRPGQTGKSHSFGGYGPQSQARLARGDSVNSTKSAGPAVYAKQDSSHSQQTWRISPSSSGYKTQSQSIQSESITPSPSYGSVSGEHTPEPAHPVTASGVVWAVTDMASVPKGSVLIDPQTLQPIVNQDGSIYHFDPTNLPQCSKLQIMAASPTSTTPTAPSPTFAPHEAAQTRKKYKPKPNTVRDDDDDGGPNANCDNDGTSSGVVRNSSNPEIEISSLPCNNSDNSGSISEAPAPITMNTLLAPINQIHAEICSNSGADNDSDDTSSERCPSSTSFLNVNAATTIVRNQSTSPNMPDANVEAASDDAAQYVKPNVEPEAIAECENVNRSPSMDTKDNNYDNEASEMRPANKNDKLATESPPISTEYGKKDEIKMMPAVLPVLGYTAAPAPNVYPTIDSGIQMYPGAQPAPTAYPTTTYQQGLDGSVYAVSQPMVYGYPAPMENEYPSIFLPMYDQSLQPSNAQGALMPATAPPTPSSSTMYPTTGATTMAVLPYGASPNIYPGQVIYTSDQYNPTNSTLTPQQQYINFPIGYTTYPYNGSPAYPAYWGQAAMTYYVPQPMSSTAHGATNSVLPSPSMNGPNTNQLIGPPLLQHSASHNTNSSNNNNTTSNMNSSNNNTNPHNTSSRNNTPINKNFNSSSSSSTSSNTIDNTNHIVSQQKSAPPNSQNVHGNNTPTVPVPNAYTPSPSGENKLPNYSGPSQPNVFQYPCAVTVSSTPNYGNTSITSTVAGSGSQTPNQPAMISTPGRSHFSNSPSTTASNEASPSIAPSGKPNLYNVGPHAHVPPSPSTHINTANTKNNPPLFPTPNNILTNGIVPHINQDYHDTGNTGNNTSSYERKKNQQNSNRKTYSNGSYRPISGANSNATYNNQPMHPSSSSGSNPNARKPALMPQPQPTEPNAQQSYNVAAQHNGNRTPPAAVAYNRNNSNNSQGEHNDKRPPMNTNANRNHSHASGSGAGSSIMHGKGAPLIPTLPVNAHTSNTFEQRPRGPRPKPLDLRRSANSSTRNTPSTNSTESNNNNSPNSIVSNSIQHPAHQTPLYISRGAHPSVHHSTQNALEAAACSSLAYNPHSGMYVKLGGQAYITHSMTFPNKPHQTDVRQQQLQPLTGIYPTMNMMLTGFPQATRPLGPRPSHVNPNYKGNRAPR